MRASIGKLVQSAIAAVGDIAEPITYNAKVMVTYDPNTGDISENTTEYTLNAVISTIKTDSRFPSENGITPDLSVLFASIDLPIVANTGDTITRGLENYKIIKIMLDPAGASTELYISKIG